MTVYILSLPHLSRRFKGRTRRFNAPTATIRGIYTPNPRHYEPGDTRYSFGVSPTHAEQKRRITWTLAKFFLVSRSSHVRLQLWLIPPVQPGVIVPARLDAGIITQPNAEALPVHRRTGNILNVPFCLRCTASTRKICLEVSIRKSHQHATHKYDR